MLAASRISRYSGWEKKGRDSSSASEAPLTKKISTRAMASGTAATIEMATSTTAGLRCPAYQCPAPGSSPLSRAATAGDAERRCVTESDYGVPGVCLYPGRASPPAAPSLGRRIGGTWGKHLGV